MDNFSPSDVQETTGTDLSGRKGTRQMYLLEIFIDKVTIFEHPPEIPDDEPPVLDVDKNLIVKVGFLSNAQFIFKENQLAFVSRHQDAPKKIDDHGTSKWSRTFRVGKSYLFISDPVQLMRLLAKYPLKFDLWSDSLTEESELIGSGTMLWDTDLYFLTKEAELGSLPENCQSYRSPLSMKQRTTLQLECCCRLAAEVDFILRLSAVGDCIGAYFQQLLDYDPYAYAFLADNVTSMFECRRVETKNNDRVQMHNTIHDIALQEDPETRVKANRKIQVCTELQSCGAVTGGQDALCHGQKDAFDIKVPIKAIKMGDISGPCGNVNCELAHKIKNYIRNLNAYKKRALEPKISEKPEKPNRICGKCVCREDLHYRDTKPKNLGKKVCTGCGGVAQGDETCDDRLKALHGTGLTPIGSKTNFIVPKPKS